MTKKLIRAISIILATITLSGCATAIPEETTEAITEPITEPETTEEDAGETDEAPEEVTEETEEETAEEAAAAPEEAPAASADGQTVVEISKLMRPGTALSGSVKFASGSTADWYIDQTGRLGLENLVGNQPTQEDIQQFQIELEKAVYGGR